MAARAVHANAHRALWLSFGAIICATATIQGAGYLLGGDAVASSPSWYVMRQVVPGGMRTHGAIMLALALAFSFVMRDNRARCSRYLLQAFSGYAFLVAVSIFGSWWITAKIVFGAPWWWLALAGITAIMIVYPPPSSTVPVAAPPLSATTRQ